MNHFVFVKKKKNNGIMKKLVSKIFKATLYNKNIKRNIVIFLNNTNSFHVKIKVSGI